MTDKQQWVASADMLSGARNNGDGGSGLPPDSMVTDFQAVISSDCMVIPTINIAELAATEYLTDRAHWRP